MYIEVDPLTHSIVTKNEFCLGSGKQAQTYKGGENKETMNQLGFLHLHLNTSGIDIEYKMKLAQYTQSFNEPIRNQDTATLIRLLAARNKTARGLSDTIGHVDVRLLSAHNLNPTVEGERGWKTGHSGRFSKQR